jgi:hypothetical protein
MALKTLHDLFPSLWADGQPETLEDLLSAEYEHLDETAKALRALAVKAAHSLEREPILTARTARELIEKHRLPVRRGFWTSIPLDARRERVYSRKEGAGMRMIHALSRKFPIAEILLEKAPLPVDGQYLLLYGGGLEVLDDRNLHAYLELIEAAEVADVILWDESDVAATFWSVRAGCGARGSERIEFPELDILERWQQ